MPVTVRRVKTDDEIDWLRIVENLNRRHVTPYEYALNIAKLIRITREESQGAESTMRTPIIAQLAERLGVHSDKVKKSLTISKLIPQLGQLLNDKVISQFAAW